MLNWELQAAMVATPKTAANGRPVRIRQATAIVIGALLLGPLTTSSAVPDWQKTVTPLPRGDFPNPRSLVANYDFGWSSLTAATGEVRFANFGNKLQIAATGQTIGIVRGLWRFDTHHLAIADASTLQPISMHQLDEFRSKTLTTDLTFHPGRVDRFRTDSSSSKPPSKKAFTFASGIYDLHSALLTLRSQPMKTGDVYRLVVYPATNPYLATLTVTGR